MGSNARPLRMVAYGTESATNRISARHHRELEEQVVCVEKEFSTLLGEDLRLRKYILNKYQFSGIPKIEIERTRDQVIVHLHTARPGIIIGRKGQEVDKLKAELEEFTGRRMDLKIVEVAQPARNANLIAEDIAQQLLKRTSFRRAMKKSMDTVMESGVRSEGAVVGSLGRGGNVPHGKGDSRLDPAVHNFEIH